MTKVLVLNNWAVYPPRSGGHQAVYQLCSGLAQRFRCTYAFLSEGAEVEMSVSQDNGLQLLELPGRHPRNTAGKWKAPGFLHSERVTKFALRASAVAALRARVAALIDDHDVVVFSHPWAWATARNAPGLHNKFVVYDSHNVEAELARQAEAPWVKKLVNLRAVTHLERDLCQRADLILTCTEEDKDYYERHYQVPSRNMEIGFKGVHCSEHSGSELVGFGHRGKRALFLGSDWAPNNQAARIVAFQLAQALPSIEWIIAGTCSRQIVGNVPPNVRLMGYVEDLPALMRQSLLAVNPTLEGSGINMKMMEYMAAGLPVVTTQFGARGIVGPAREALVITDIDKFPEAIRRLANSGEQWSKLSVQSRLAAQKQYDWNAINARLASLISAGVSSRNIVPLVSSNPALQNRDA